MSTDTPLLTRHPPHPDDTEAPVEVPPVQLTGGWLVGARCLVAGQAGETYVLSLGNHISPLP